LGDESHSSLGGSLFPSEPLEHCQAPTDVIVAGGIRTDDLTNPKLSTWLSRHIRGNVRVTGLITGALALAHADLVRDTPVTLHWHYRDTFAELYPDATLIDRPYVADARCGTSSGGISAIDLFLAYIAQDHGAEFSTQVAEAMNYATVQQVQQIATAEASVRSRVKNANMRAALKLMEDNLEEPVPPSKIAESIGISTRQLERLFQQYLQKSPKQHYMGLRLKRAYFLLSQTEMSIIDIGLACGFGSSSHFAKCFRMEFGRTPTQMQKAL